jgi:hypothetical protein
LGFLTRIKVSGGVCVMLSERAASLALLQPPADGFQSAHFLPCGRNRLSRRSVELTALKSGLFSNQP